jgi:chromosomal replication initiation ATPase DnaA
VFRPSIDEITEKVASSFEVSRESIVRTTRGSNNNVLRWVAMYLCQEVCDYRLVKISFVFWLKARWQCSNED